jgi:hypothetical protein
MALLRWVRHEALLSRREDSPAGYAAPILLVARSRSQRAGLQDSVCVGDKEAASASAYACS